MQGRGVREPSTQSIAARKDMQVNTRTMRALLPSEREGAAAEDRMRPVPDVDEVPAKYAGAGAIQAI